MSESCENCRRAGPMVESATAMHRECRAILDRLDVEGYDQALMDRADELQRHAADLLARAREWVGVA
jgi:hypothetical protein